MFVAPLAVKRCGPPDAPGVSDLSSDALAAKPG